MITDMFTNTLESTNNSLTTSGTDGFFFNNESIRVYFSVYTTINNQEEPEIVAVAYRGVDSNTVSNRSRLSVSSCLILGWVKVGGNSSEPKNTEITSSQIPPNKDQKNKTNCTAEDIETISYCYSDSENKAN